jgi:ribosome biogenesis protein MAK21
LITEPEADDEEHFKDAPDSDDEEEEEKRDDDATVAKKSAVANGANGASADRYYDGRKREPQFANAQTSCLWELVCLLSFIFRPPPHFNSHLSN